MIRTFVDPIAYLDEFCVHDDRINEKVTSADKINVWLGDPLLSLEDGEEFQIIEIVRHPL